MSYTNIRIPQDSAPNKMGDDLGSIFARLNARRSAESGMQQTVEFVAMRQTQQPMDASQPPMTTTDVVIPMIGDESGDEGDDMSVNEQMVSVEHPDVYATEALLGPVSEDDDWCYLCESVSLHDTQTLGKEAKEIQDAITAGRPANSSNLVLFAKKIKTDYDQNIWQPAHDDALAAGRTAISLRQWTLRSVYRHILDHDTSMAGVIDKVIHDLARCAGTLQGNGMYIAPKRKVRNGRVTKAVYVKIDPIRHKMYLDTLNRLGSFAKLKQECNTPKKGGGGGGSKSLSSTKAATTSISAIANAATSNAVAATSGGPSASSEVNFRPSPLPTFRNITT